MKQIFPLFHHMRAASLKTLILLSPTDSLLWLFQLFIINLSLICLYTRLPQTVDHFMLDYGDLRAHTQTLIFWHSSSLLLLTHAYCTTLTDHFIEITDKRSSVIFVLFLSVSFPNLCKYLVDIEFVLVQFLHGGLLLFRGECILPIEFFFFPSFNSFQIEEVIRRDSSNWSRAYTHPYVLLWRPRHRAHLRVRHASSSDGNVSLSACSPLTSHPISHRSSQMCTRCSPSKSVYSYPVLLSWSFL